MEWDGSSGGVIRLAAIAEPGVERQVLLGKQIHSFLIKIYNITKMTFRLYSDLIFWS